jgi:glutathione S-transferase
MILIGMFDSPFVRRVAVSMRLLGKTFEHRNWSVGKDLDRIREYNPVGRVPTLVLDDGESLIESAAILDYIDEGVGAERALLPRTGRDRRAALRIMALATGATEKGLAQLFEVLFRPEQKRHEPWLERCRTQMHGGLAELDRICAKRGAGQWLIADRMTRADITTTCMVTYLNDALALSAERASYPALRELVARCAALPEFAATYVPFVAPSAR